MVQRDRITVALEAAEAWTPMTANQDPDLIRFARQNYAEGYAAALWDVGLVRLVRLEGRQLASRMGEPPFESGEIKLPERDWPVAPC